MIVKHHFLKTFFLLVYLVGIISGNFSQTKRSAPNIVLIFMDDLGYGDIDAYGSLGYSTPNLNQLAAEGMRFTNFYSAQAVCTASRAGIITGCYPNRVGLAGALFPGAKIGLNSNEETMPEMLKKIGYRTSIIGKWHLGDAQKFLPLQHGFDEYFGIPYSNDMWPVDYDGKPITDTTTNRGKLPPLPLIEGNRPIRYINNLEDMKEITSMYTERAVKFIQRNKTTSFFLYLCHSMVHVPLAVSDKFKGKSKQGLFGDVMMEVDWSVGQVMNALKENNLEKNTIVIFTSDNGPWLTFGDHAGSAGGLREGKQTVFEGGQRVPAIIKWPQVIPQGAINNKIASTIDLLPTFAAITGATLPIQRIDGVNILPLLTGDNDANPRAHFLYYFNQNSLKAIRKGDWKLVLPHRYNSQQNQLPGNGGFPGKSTVDSTGLALYDLRRDPGERYDVKDQNPDIVKSLLLLVEEAREDLGDDLTGRKGANRREPGKL
jgi:arylsulfatase